MAREAACEAFSLERVGHFEHYFDELYAACEAMGIPLSGHAHESALSQYEGTMLFVSHDRHFLAALSNRVLELTPEGIHQYGGGYTEYVARTGHEAPGLRS